MLTEGRPTGVTVVAVLAAIAGIGPLVYAIIGFIGATSTWLSPGPTSAIPATVMAIFYLAVGVAYFAVGWGLYTLRPWAWLAAVAVTAITVLGNIVAAFGGNIGWPQAILASIIPLAVVVYLLRAEVRTAFGR